jgi:hypothetical protein
MRLLAAACLASHVSQANHTQLDLSSQGREREISWAGFLNTKRVTHSTFGLHNKDLQTKSSLQSVTATASPPFQEEEPIPFPLRAIYTL